MNFEYKCVEIVSKKKVIEYAKVIMPDHMNFYVNSNDDMIFAEIKG